MKWEDKGMSPEIIKKAVEFEKSHDLETIRSIALRMKCGKLDYETLRRIKTKDQMIFYLRTAKCPALNLLEASYIHQ
jgi:uncharacterized protein with ATP-grasp and redox domains